MALNDTPTGTTTNGARLILADGRSFDVEEVTLIDSEGDSLLFEVWVKRGDGDE